MRNRGSSRPETFEERNRHARLDRLIDRLVARLWGGSERSGVLFVFNLGRGDLMLLVHTLAGFRRLLEAGERADILMRDGVLEDIDFLIPDWLSMESLPAIRFQKRWLPRLFWSLRIARRRYRRAIVFNTTWSPLRDERLGWLAVNGPPDAAISFPESDIARARKREKHGTSRYFLNSDQRHSLEFWAAFAAHLTDRPALAVTPHFDTSYLAPPRRESRPHVVLHPFPSFASKYFGPEIYAPLIDTLAASHDVLISTGPNDLAKYPEMRALGEQAHVRFAELSLKDIVPLVRGADLVISVDTALAHLGIGCAAPTLVLHNTDDPGVYMPYPASVCPADVAFLEIPAVAGSRDERWRPGDAWTPVPGTAARVHDAAMALLGRV